MNVNEQLDVIYTDFAKAFDTVNFEILLFKLFNIGFNHKLIAWLRSYLTNRAMYVKYNSTLSSCFLGSSGVPQGSILGPLLFLLFINDISSNFQTCLLFADDLKIFRQISSHNDIEHLQSELKKLTTRCIQNKLYLNTDKCFVLTFSRKNNPLLYDYNLNSVIISRKSHIKDLGVTYNSSFSFKLHIQNIKIKASKNLGMLKRTTLNFFDNSVLTSLFNTLVRPILEYNCVIWNPSNVSLYWL